MKIALKNLQKKKIIRKQDKNYRKINNRMQNAQKINRPVSY